MNIKKILVGGATGALMLGAVVVSVFAAQPVNTVLVNNWTVYNRSDIFAKLWDDNKATALEDGGVGFEFNQEDTTWYTAYLKAHYNGDLTDKIITANIDVIGEEAAFVSRIINNEPLIPPTVGLVIKSAEGNWGVNDYWWPTNRRLLSELDTNDEISASTADENRAYWINICGQHANEETTSPPGTPDCVGGTYPAESPYDGFTKALKNVKEVGLSFGGNGWARGVALIDGTASFQLNSFTVTP